MASGRPIVVASTPYRPRDVGAGLAGVEATEGFLIVRPRRSRSQSSAPSARPPPPAQP